MRLYIICPDCDRKVYLAVTARNRHELMRKWSYEFNIETHPGRIYKYNVDKVRAERSGRSTGTGALVGGLVGLIGGPIGVAAGTGIGSLWGYNKDMDEQAQVDYFNSIWVK